MEGLEQVRHPPLTPLSAPRELIVACEPMRTNINLSRIMRTAGCCGVRKVVCCGTAKVIGKIARDAAETVEVEVHRTLSYRLKELKAEGYTLVGLEQTNSSQIIWDYPFPTRTVLIIGNERLGIQDDVLALLHAAVEIPVYGLPYSYNAATAASMALYEFCRQHPK